MDARVVARRHKKATEEASRRDSAYFRNNLDRLHRVRPSLPFEVESWGEGDHEKLPYMIVRRSQDWSRWDRYPVTLQTKKALPNDEQFLSLFLQEFDQRKEAGGMIHFSGEQVFRLLEEAGLAEKQQGDGSVVFTPRAQRGKRNGKAKRTE